jgi:hypothetical protein
VGGAPGMHSIRVGGGAQRSRSGSLATARDEVSAA